MKNPKDKILSDYLKVLMEINEDGIIDTYFQCKMAIQIAVAENPGTPPDILDLLASSGCTDNKVKQRVAQNPNTLLQTLVKLSKSKAWIVGNHVHCHDKWKDPDREEKIKFLIKIGML